MQQENRNPWCEGRRLRECVEAWPEAETGGWNPACCRFPKSCSATIYGDGTGTAVLEPCRVHGEGSCRATG